MYDCHPPIIAEEHHKANAPLAHHPKEIPKTKKNHIQATVFAGFIGQLNLCTTALRALYIDSHTLPPLSFLSYFILLYPTCQYCGVFCHIIFLEVVSLKPLKEKISITIDNDILAKLKEQAEYDDRSLSQYINLVLKQHIKDLEEKK
jgi:hypothetical protein